MAAVVAVAMRPGGGGMRTKVARPDARDAADNGAAFLGRELAEFFDGALDAFAGGIGG